MSVLLRRFAGLSFALTFLAAALPASADTWILANGDRLTGRLVTETDAAIEIEHPQLGRLVLARAQLQGAVTEQAEEAVTAANPAPAAPSAAPASSGAPTGAVAAAAGTRLGWKRQLELGYTMQEGAKSKQDISVRGQVELRRGANSFRGTARALRSEAQGVVTLDRHEADFRWRRDFSRRLFAQSLTTYAADDVRRIDLSLEQQLGGGYRIVDGDRQTMNVGLGAVLQRLAREGFDDQTALLGSFFQDYAFTLNDRLKLAQEASVFVADSASLAARGGRTVVTGAPADGNYRLKFNTTLQSKMTDQVSLNLRYEYDYDRSLPDPDLRADSRLTTSLGYTW